MSDTGARPQTSRIELMSGAQLAGLPKPTTSVPRVADVVNIERFNVSKVLLPFGEICICYDSVPLWRTQYPLKAIDILLAEPDEEEPYMLVCVDIMGDFYTYGSWRSLEEVKAWLLHPKALY